MIKFIYFDVGGVVIKDFSGTDKFIELKRELGITPQQDKEFDKLFYKHEPVIGAGKNAEELLPLIKEKFGIDIPNGYSLLDSFVRRFERNEYIEPILESISSNRHFNIGLLTNMYPGMLESIKKHHLLPTLDWDVVVDSSIEGVVKPQDEIFRIAEQKAHAAAEEILFVENNKENADRAKQLGWNTFIYDSLNYKKASLALAREIEGLK